MESLERKRLLYKRLSRHAMGNALAVYVTYGDCQHPCIKSLMCITCVVACLVSCELSSPMDANPNMNFLLANWHRAGMSVPKDSRNGEHTCVHMIFHLVFTLMTELLAQVVIVPVWFSSVKISISNKSFHMSFLLQSQMT